MSDLSILIVDDSVAVRRARICNGASDGVVLRNAILSRPSGS